MCKLSVSQRESIRQYLETDLALELAETEKLRRDLRRGPDTAGSARGGDPEDVLENVQKNVVENAVENAVEAEVEAEVEFLTAVPAEKEKEEVRKRRLSGRFEPERNEQKRININMSFLGREESARSPPRARVGRPRKNSPTLPCSQCGEKFGSRSGLSTHRRKNHLNTDQNKVAPVPVQSDIQSAGEKNLLAAESKQEETRAVSGETEGNSEEADMTKMLLVDNQEGSEDEEDLEILSETIIQKYDDLQVKLEPVEFSATSEEEGNHPASRVVSLMKKSKYFTEHPNMFSVCSESEAGTFPRELRFLPGWRVKTMEVRRKTGEVVRTSYFLSPDQVQLLSGISVIEYLRVTGQPDQIIDLTSRKMKISQKTLQQYRLNYY